MTPVPTENNPIRRLSAWRVELAWAAAVVALLIAGAWRGRSTGSSAEDSYSAAAGGKRAFFALNQSLARRVGRQLGPQLTPDDTFSTLCILGPARYPTSDEWYDLYRWVSRGNTLVFAARHSDPAVDLESFDIRVVPDSLVEPERESSDSDKPSPENQLAELFRKPKVETELVDGELDWQRTARIQTTRDDVDVLVRVDGDPLVVRQVEGAGQIVVVASDYVFCNRSLVTPNNGLLAFRIVEAGGRAEAVAFDESLNVSGTPTVFGLLFSPRLRPLTLQAMLCAVVFGWQGGRRFGAVLPALQPPRRNICEHAIALGNLHYRAASGARALALYLDHFRNELRLHYSRASGVQEATLLARRSKLPVETVRALLADVHKATQERASVSRAAALISKLARIRRALDCP